MDFCGDAWIKQNSPLSHPFVTVRDPDKALKENHWVCSLVECDTVLCLNNPEENKMTHF